MPQVDPRLRGDDEKGRGDDEKGPGDDEKGRGGGLPPPFYSIIAYFSKF